MPENYYEILGLSNNCTKAEIDKAYKRLALEYHPDKNKSDDADKNFREITKAYQVLSDDETRKNYDTYGITTKTDNLIDPYVFFKNMFDTEDNSIPNVIVYIDVNINDLYHGKSWDLSFDRFSPCDKCDANGTSNKKKSDCKTCIGRGMVFETVKGGNMGYMINEKKCDTCDGIGIDPSIKKCVSCNGAKYIQENVECSVDIPAGAYDKYFIKIEDEGNYIPLDDRKYNKKERSDVIIVINEIIPPECNIRRGMFIKELNRINRADILYEMNITFAESIVGLKKNFDLFNQTISIEIDNVIQNGDIYVIEDMGMCSIENKEKEKGDLFILFKVNKPEITKQQKKRLWQILTGSSYPEYDDMINPVDSVTLSDYIKNNS